MLVPFNDLPGHSKIWIFQSSRLLLPDEIILLKSETDLFLQEWAAHNRDLRSSSLLFKNLFLVIAVDETAVNASGCSIDKLFQFIKSLQTKLNIDFLDRLKVAFLNEDNMLVLSSLKEIEQMLQAGKIDGELIVFDCTITKVEDFSHKFIVPLKDSWLHRYQTA